MTAERDSIDANAAPDSADGASTESQHNCSEKLIPGRAEQIVAVKPRFRPELFRLPVLPIATDVYANQLTQVNDDMGAYDLFDFARQRPISFIGMNMVFRYRDCGVATTRTHTWHDPRSIEPLLLALTLVERVPEHANQTYRFVVDVRCQEVPEQLVPLFQMPVQFVAHGAADDLFCLWQLGIPAPTMLWDTAIAERAFQLGVHHGRYQKVKPGDDLAAICARETAAARIEAECELLATCQRRNVAHPFGGSEPYVPRSFLTHPSDKAFTAEQAEYVSARVEAVVGLYPVQVQVAVDCGALDHLITMEMPWTTTNARMTWDGVRFDSSRATEVLKACDRHIRSGAVELAKLGIRNIDSYDQLKAYFTKIGRLAAFRVGDRYSFDDDHLEAAKDQHPAIASICSLRTMNRLRKSKLLTGELVGVDGRLHPEHHQLGAASGRNTMSCPNVSSMGRALRPLVIPEPGFLIGEVDLCQIEVGIAAAVYGDPDLLQMFNGSDVYSSMARRYYAAELSPEAKDLPDQEFKLRHEALRDRMKEFALATIYNITPYSLAVRLNTPFQHALTEQQRFLNMFPFLAKAMWEASIVGAIRGHAYFCSGLRRRRGKSGTPTPWEVNWLRNTPVQGSASVVFKAAGNRLYRRYQYFGARLILPMHDAFVFEAPCEHLSTVADITAEVMRSAVQEYFPALNPRVEVNIEHPECWNKAGRYDSWQKWIDDPEQVRKSW